MYSFANFRAKWLAVENHSSTNFSLINRRRSAIFHAVGLCKNSKAAFACLANAVTQDTLSFSFSPAFSLGSRLLKTEWLIEVDKCLHAGSEGYDDTAKCSRLAFRLSSLIMSGCFRERNMVEVQLL